MLAAEAVKIAKDLHEGTAIEQSRLDTIADAMKPDLSARSLHIPKDAQPEMLDFAAKSRTNYLPLVVDVLAGSLRVVGYRGSESSENLAAWNIWQRNMMDAKQAGIIRAALTYGYSFSYALAGTTGPVFRGRSPRQMVASYDEVLDDAFPRYALDMADRNRWRLFDSEAVYTFRRDGDKLAVDSETPHGLGICPVVRHRDRIDLDLDMPMGVVEPLIPIQSRIDETVFGLLTAQYFGAFLQRWVTGWTSEKDDAGNPKPIKSSARHLLTFEDPDVKIGQFSATDLKGYLDSKQSGVQDLAAISQVPPQALLGEMVNLSAEALTATMHGTESRAAEIRVSLGESFEQLLRLGAVIAGDPQSAGDDLAQVRWEDTSARSLAQVVDALTKLATGLNVPPSALWDRIPDVTDQDIERWTAIAETSDPLARLADEFAAQADSGNA